MLGAAEHPQATPRRSSIIVAMSAKPRKSPDGGGFENNRAHERVPIDAFVRILGHDREYVFRTRDLSEGGMFLHTRVGHLYPFTVGSEVAIEVQAAERVVSLTGVVTRVSTQADPTQPAGFALRMHPPDLKTLTVLRGILGMARAGTG